MSFVLISSFIEIFVLLWGKSSLTHRDSCGPVIYVCTSQYISMFVLRSCFTVPFPSPMSVMANLWHPCQRWHAQPSVGTRIVAPVQSSLPDR